MPTKAKLPLLMLALVLSSAASAQENRIAKLLSSLKVAKEDTSKAILYYSISRRYWERNLDSVLLMATKGIALSDSLGFKKGKALNCLSMGVGLSGMANYPAGIKYYLECLKICEELKMEGLSGNVYTNIAIAYASQGNLAKADTYYSKALHIAEKYGEAATCSPLLNLADLHTEAGNLTLAKSYALRALKISLAQYDSSSLAIALFNISEIHLQTNQLDSAQWYLKRSAHISTRIHDYAGISFCLNSLAEIKVRQGKHQEGIALATQSLANLERADDNELRMNAYHLLYQSYNATGDFNKALYFRNQEIALKETLTDIKKAREANNLINQYNLERKDLQIQLLEKDSKLKQKEIARESLIKTIYGGGAIALLLFAAYLIFMNARWKSYHRMMKESNALILDQKDTIVEQKANLERLNSSKDKIISIISHDFRSPLATLHSFVKVLTLNVLTSEEKAQVTKQIEHSLAVTLDMIENLLTWSSGQLGGLTLHPTCFDITELVNENVQLIYLRAQNKKITIRNTISPSTSIYGDRDTINIVLRNLISNAVKFSRQDESIYIGLQEEQHRVIMSVKDSGIGMSAEQQETLFAGSVNTATVGTENEKGSGLGLMLCQELIHQHGGKIWVESTIGKGSCFFFSIPHSPLSSGSMKNLQS